MTRTFKYKGKNPTHLVIHEGFNHELKKGEPFTTDNARLATILAERDDMEEVTAKDPQTKETATEPRRSRPDGGKS